ncbi:nicotinamide mononucleotide transport protein [Escherichia coli]|nr:nicotinamide mononucleotide transport protein [Escherichia coli]
MDFFSVQNILVHIPIGAGGYDLSWIEAVADRRVAVYWPCQSGEDQQLLLWPDQRHLVWHYFLSDSAVCQPAITGVFLCREYLRLVCVVATNQSERGGVENSLVAIAEGTQLVGGLRCFDWV